MKRNRSVFEPELAPLFSDFEDVGMHGALARMRVRLQERAPTLVVPEWVWSLDYAFAVTECARCDDTTTLLEALASATHELGSADSAPPSATEAPTTTFQRAAIVRARLGELLEALAAHVARGLVGVEHAPAHDVDKRALATLYHDSCCVAVWTSAHAEYLGCIHDLLGGYSATEERVRDFMMPPPELHTVANFGHLLHLGALTERTASARCCSKSSQALLAILTRVTNTGSRGWETTLLAALNESEGAVRTCMQSLAVALSGLHPAIHPGARRPWRERFVLLRALRVHTQQDFKEVVQKAPNAIKESVRLHLACTFLADRATHDAMRYTCHPAGLLCVPPLDMPAGPLAAAMHRMADAGGSMVATRESVGVAIRRHLVSEPRSRKKAESRTSRHSRHEVETLSYSSSWLGGRSGPSSHLVRPAIQVVSGLLSASYRSTWIPFWLHGNHHGYRASRLDSAQYAALHNQSAAHRMCTLLSDEQFQKAERVALANADASLLAVPEACALLGIVPNPSAAPGTPCSASTRAVQDAEVEVMNLRADDAALLVAFARIAALRSALLSYDLGAQTRRRQSLAICQRLLLPLAPGEDPCEAVRTRLPRHATVLYCCSECRRVVNSVQDNTGKDMAFNELGLSSSMLTVDCATCSSHMRCAKRSTAALRTAVALETSAEKLELEQLEPVAAPLLPRDLRPATIVSTMCVPKGGGGGAKRNTSGSASGPALRDSSSEVAKFRRDLKSCFEQSERATSCGDVPLVRVPILGRAVRVFGNWYALCSMCGALARVTPASRFRDEICCLRCDFAMLAGKNAASEMRAALHKPPAPSCRFCGKAEPENGAGMKWRRIPAPADTGGSNAFVPPPLRVVWCAPLLISQTPHRSCPCTHFLQKVLPDALPGVACDRAHAQLDVRDLCAPAQQGETHPRRRRGRRQQTQEADDGRRRRGRRRGRASANASPQAGQRRHQAQVGTHARHHQEQSPATAGGEYAMTHALLLF